MTNLSPMEAERDLAKVRRRNDLLTISMAEATLRAETAEAESAALREEIKKLTLLSDSQLANQERLATGLVAIVTALGIADGTMPLTGPQVLLLADEAKHCCERLVGEKWIDVNQELLQMAGWVLVQIKERPDIPEVRSYTGELGWITWMAGHYPFNPATVIRWMPLPDPPATLAPKDTPTEPTQEK